MIRFRTFLLEYLTDEQRDRYKDIHMTDKARADTDHFFGVGNDKIHGEIQHDDKSEIHKQLENHLGRTLSHDEYRTGVVKDKYGRDTKIGRMIKDNDLRNQFDHDVARRTGYKPTIKTTTVRGVEVAGQTNPTPNAEHPTGHSWPGSCKNVEDGINKRYLKPEIQHGTVVHFVHDHNGQEIYRATLHPHHNEKGDVAYAVDAEYGIKHPKFRADAQRVAKELSGKFKPGIFTKHPEVYNDSGERYIGHPNATAEDIHHILKHGTDEEKHDALRSKVINADHITYVMDHEPNAGLRATAMKTRAVNADHIMKGLNDPEHVVRRAAATNDLTPEHITRAIQSDQPSEVRREAIRDRSATPEHISHIIKHDPDINVVRQALRSPASNASHVSMALEHPNAAVRLAAIHSPDVTTEHLDKAIKDSDAEVASLAVKHPLAQPRHISYALQHGHKYVKEAALTTGTVAQPEHLGSIINSTDPKITIGLKRLAASHPNVSKQNITDALKLNDPEINYDIASDVPHLSKEHLDTLSKVRDRDVMHALSRRDDLHAEHIMPLLNSGYETINRRMLFHPKLNQDHMLHILKNETNRNIRTTLFDRTHIPKEVISHAIRHDPDDMVRYYAIRHPDAHPDDLAHAAMHEDDTFNIGAAINRIQTPMHAIQHVARKYKGQPLGKEAEDIIRKRGEEH